ncbi:uncharacterized protein G2W53_026540 [Senna tora]|uniref:Death-associated protein 1 n=1 Tax=Senna tora TaxID=362788 RepID=A0A834TFV8_9FABA|nr:uncharacterized protein G2W53_026540 [Senna tora]
MGNRFSVTANLEQPPNGHDAQTEPKQSSHPVKKASKPHLEKSQEHTVVVSHSQGIKIGQSISKSPAKVKDSIPRIPPKGPPDPPKAK